MPEDGRVAGARGFMRTRMPYGLGCWLRRFILSEIHMQERDCLTVFQFSPCLFHM